jgi:signal peptidase I
MTTDDGPRPVGATGEVPPAQPSPSAAQIPPLVAEDSATRRSSSSRSRRARRGRNQRRARKQHKSFLRELPGIVITALVISVLIKTFLVQAFFIPSGSMENTLLVNDRVLVNKLVDKPDEVHRGDVVVFRDPGGWLEGSQPSRGGLIGLIRSGLVFVGLAPAAGEEDLIKRVIGVGGDKVACCDAKGRVTVNGVPLDEPYLYPGDVPSQDHFSVTVPQGELWVMGDHRSVSEDSRAHKEQPGKGFVPVKDVIGRAFTVVWPLDRARLLHRPATFEQPGLASGP